MATANEISGLHRGLESDLRALLGQPIRIKDLAGGRWGRKAPGETPVVFHLIRDQGAEFVSGMPVVALVPAMPASQVTELAAPESQLWVAWDEKWERQAAKGFALGSAGWTVFWGQAGDPQKAKILRAEWFGRSFLDPRESNAAQPHWHVDPPLPVRELVAGELEEHAAVRGTVPRESRLSIKEVHLAMGGWRNHERPPQCWQLNLAEEPERLCERLREWAVRTLGYLQTQADSFKLCVVEV